MFKPFFLISVALTGLALSASTVSITPLSSSIQVGASTAVTIEIGGLSSNQAIGAFDLTVQSDSSIISAVTVKFLGALGDPANQLTASSLGASTNAAESSFETTATLLGLQPTQPVSVFEITYKGLAAGISQLTFLTNPAIVANGAGTILPITSFGTASITVTGNNNPNPSPEPASMMLLSGGLFAVFVASRKRIKRS